MPVPVRAVRPDERAATLLAGCFEVIGGVPGKVEICAVSAERLVIERELPGPLPSLRASIGRQVARKVDRLACVRFALGHRLPSRSG